MPAIRSARASKEARSSPYPGGSGDSKGKGKGKGTSSSSSRSQSTGPGLPLNKMHGQHLLKNPGIIDKIISAADIKEHDTVMEIGPGTGNLTMKVLELARKVVALEIDPRMASEVRKRAMGAGRMNLEVLEGNALTTEWPTFQVCTANLPYAISSPFTFKLLAHRPLFRCAVLMFQLEFALRLVAEVGDTNYGRLALNVKLFCKVSTVCKVSRGSFNPPPEVDSMVVKIVPRDPPIEVNFREWDGLMRVVFVRKRKTLASSFKMTFVLKTLDDNYKTWCALTSTVPSKKPMKDMIMEVLNEKGLAEKRAITIDLDTYFHLLLAFNQKGIHFSGTPTAGAGKDADDRFFEDMDEDGE
eukprot:gnl/MRDRNA2_/MRDRNA2_101400_c0_seq1.p1 gnl/MRDRNA2_/MRDRNA2_101400_c0~~gnl/MRDRNA2_/MRDRNA2_101400_c0_seq1.p1  ORF type:complete len:356 (+),score=66.88 gnl/MRDRNA2_/MRDRNA2_101400_c0_seq1:84-1151(+)